MSLSGGPAEIVITGDRATLTVHGAKGVRQARLPGEWKAAAPLQLQNGAFTLKYDGPQPLTLTLTRFR